MFMLFITSNSSGIKLFSNEMQSITRLNQALEKLLERVWTTFYEYLQQKVRCLVLGCRQLLHIRISQYVV